MDSEYSGKLLLTNNSSRMVNVVSIGANQNERNDYYTRAIANGNFFIYLPDDGEAPIFVRIIGERVMQLFPEILLTNISEFVSEGKADELWKLAYYFRGIPVYDEIRTRLQYIYGGVLNSAYSRDLVLLLKRLRNNDLQLIITLIRLINHNLRNYLIANILFEETSREYRGDVTDRLRIVDLDRNIISQQINADANIIRSFIPNIFMVIESEQEDEYYLTLIDFYRNLNVILRANIEEWMIKEYETTSQFLFALINDILLQIDRIIQLLPRIKTLARNVGRSSDTASQALTDIPLMEVIRNLVIEFYPGVSNKLLYFLTDYAKGTNPAWDNLSKEEFINLIILNM